MEWVRREVASLPADATVVSGGAPGVDSVAFQEAVKQKLRTTIFPALWQKYGKAAGMRRNHDIVRNADKVIAFWDGKSRGTRHSIGLALRANKPLVIFLSHDDSNEEVQQGVPNADGRTGSGVSSLRHGATAPVA
jgi:hypothetical protein